MHQVACHSHDNTPECIATSDTQALSGGPLDVAALQAAFDGVIARQASLRTSFADLAGMPVQTVASAAPFALRQVDLSALACQAREAQVATLVHTETALALDLAVAPLMLAMLVLGIYPALVLNLINVGVVRLFQ